MPVAALDALGKGLTQEFCFTADKDKNSRMCAHES
jgi:hypothetical protein